MAKPRVLILRSPGTNCDVETSYAFEQAGGAAEMLHVNRLLENPGLAAEFQILCLPGGFSYGDDIAAGRILASQLQQHLVDVLRQFKESDKLILGICNGFQILIKSRLLEEDQAGESDPMATLTWNDSGHFQDRWVYLHVDGSKSVFLRDIESMYLPIAHAEGKFVARDSNQLDTLAKTGQLALRYTEPSSNGQCITSQIPFPWNPNGSVLNVAGVSDVTGRVFGLMPHPERHIHRTHHPRWTREEAKAKPDGIRIFENAVGYFS